MTKTLPSGSTQYTPPMIHWRYSAIGRAAPPASPAKQLRPAGDVIYIGIGAMAPTTICHGICKSQNSTLVDSFVETASIPTSTNRFVKWPDEDHSAKRPPKQGLQEGMIEEFLEEVYGLAKLNEIEAANDRIFEHLDRLLCDGEFPVCNEVLNRVEVERLPTTLMRSFLVITAAAKDVLPRRRILYKLIEQRMSVLEGGDKTQRLIGRLA